MSSPVDHAGSIAIARTRADLAEQLAQVDQAADSGSVKRAVVMTMGALHEGHAELIRSARDLVGRQGHVTVTIFVNPTQFGVGEDLASYPRTFDADVALCQVNGADLIFAPTPEVVYPAGDPQVSVDPGPLGAQFEGVARPTHFAGVLTVVAKLLLLTKPDIAFFGEKDYQQLTLIRQMVRDLDFDVEVVGIPTVRDESGLALSSRNHYLSEAARAVAVRIPAAIAAGQAAADSGYQAVIEEVNRVLDSANSPVPMDVQYVALTDRLMGPPVSNEEGRLIVTVIVDGTRLLDNAPLTLGSGNGQ